ncbi:MAG TPA: acetolactate synthase small subunit, partial [Leptospiraceae bacterium]|nr:acetolactate synthase small subunit [Leptospiraceae bacterium]
MKHTISILVNNHPGVMSHVSGLFTRRAYNIDSIAVGVTDNPEVSS